ncbi:hypothetical protein PQX77_019332 [Marasmius sp. AFHP31]|nr:hypothetical protein PQX77_019332 [Marasmius sp. AFHP31]
MPKDAVDQFFIDWMTSCNRVVRNSGPDILVNPKAAQVISTLKNAPIAIAHLTWKDSKGPLLDQTLLENGLTRFRLGVDDEREFRLVMGAGFDAEQAWMSQAWSVFHVLGITLEDDLGDLQFTRFRYAFLDGNLSQSKAEQQQRFRQPIYLFVHPLPFNLPFNDKGKLYSQTPSLHYWSFREDGGSPLLPRGCHYFGLPTTLQLLYKLESRSWPHDNYKRIHQYQCVRGFDPTATDFARHVKKDVIIFQPVTDSIRFESESLDRLSLTLIPTQKMFTTRTILHSQQVFYTGSDNDTYTNSTHTSSIRAFKRGKACMKTLFRAAMLGLGTTLRLRIPAASLPLLTLDAKSPVLASISGVGLSSGDGSFNIVPLTPSFLTHFTALATSHPETYEDYGTDSSSAYAPLNISPLRRNNTTSLSDTLHYIGLSTMPQPTRLAVSYPLDSTITPPVHSTSNVEPTDGDVSLARHHNGGPSTSVPQQQWVPRSFVPRITSRRVPATLFSVGQPESPTGNAVNHGGNEDLD